MFSCYKTGNQMRIYSCSWKSSTELEKSPGVRRTGGKFRQRRYEGIMVSVERKKGKLELSKAEEREQYEPET